MSYTKEEHYDAIHKALESYISNLDITPDDAGGYTIVPHKIEFRDKKWYEINDAIRKLNGSWVKATQFTRAYWKIVKDNGK
jgi:hypothetical protein